MASRIYINSHIQIILLLTQHRHHIQISTLEIRIKNQSIFPILIVLVHTSEQPLVFLNFSTVSLFNRTISILFSKLRVCNISTVSREYKRIPNWTIGVFTILFVKNESVCWSRPVINYRIWLICNWMLWLGKLLIVVVEWYRCAVFDYFWLPSKHQIRGE